MPQCFHRVCVVRAGAAWAVALVLALALARAARAVEPPVNPLATREARGLLAYLGGLDGRHILSGQYVGTENAKWASADHAGTEDQQIHALTGHWPAVRGFD